MSSFDKREEGFEKKFALDEEKKFEAEARRNKLLGLWAAEKLGLAGDAANSYAKEVVASDFEEAGDADVLRKVAGDLKAKGVELTDNDIRQQMDRLSKVVIALRTRDEIYLHPFMHRFVISLFAGTVDATLEGEWSPLVRWGVQTTEALLACASGA